MTLGEKQRLFTKLVVNLLEFIHSRGYETTFGDAYRDPRAFGEIGKDGPYGHKASGHKQRLAIDINLFLDGKHLTSDKDHEPFGVWWESQHELCRWGGRFKDGNHYSLEHNGVK